MPVMLLAVPVVLESLVVAPPPVRPKRLSAAAAFGAVKIPLPSVVPPSEVCAEPVLPAVKTRHQPWSSPTAEDEWRRRVY
jgi:hypothetical protein